MVGAFIDVELVGDEIISYGTFFKGNFGDDYNDTKDLGTLGNLVVGLLSLFLLAIWIFGIINATKCKGQDRTAALIIAIFAPGIYWILKWTKVICKK